MKVLTFGQIKKLLFKYKIPFCETYLAASKKEALNFAKKIGYPVVLKVYSPEILHKTDIGGIKLDIRNENELKKAFSEILTNVKKKKPKKKIEGILVQEQISGKEVAVGMKRDLTFGPVLMFGLGGIFVEVFKDVTLRIAPIERKEVFEMIKGIKGFEILKGFRGEKPVNIEKIAQIIVKVSRLSLEKENIKEIDLNPIIVNEKQAWVVDVSFLIED